MELVSQIKALAAAIKQEVVEDRRHLHQNPELSFQEFETSKYVAQRLKQLGLEVEEGLGVRQAKTGVIGLLKGRNPNKKVVSLRADMDALPILEQNELSYKSTKPGVMHACGHDAHTASLLGTSKILMQLKDHFEGSIKFIFQPGEENLPGGASLLIEAGVLENPKPSLILGQHVWPQLPVGQVGLTKGVFLASTDTIEIEVFGKGGHAAFPHLCVDPVAISAQIIVALQQLVSRLSNPLDPVVLSICKIEGGTTHNVIPNKVSMLGTLRTMNEDLRATMLEKINQVSQSMAENFGGTSKVNIITGYPSLVNNERLTEEVQQSMVTYLGDENVVDMPKMMGGEDFAFYTHQLPGCFYVLGVGNTAKGITANVHEDTFNIDEDALELGSGLMAWLALNELARN